MQPADFFLLTSLLIKHARTPNCVFVGIDKEASRLISDETSHDEAVTVSRDGRCHNRLSRSKPVGHSNGRNVRLMRGVRHFSSTGSECS